MTGRLNIVISTGAGISAESGISTFRDSGGMWEQYSVMDVASDEGFERNPALVHQFYNQRRHDLIKAKPNAAHFALKELEQWHNVSIITQNVDDLHERAGSKNVLHLHGELMKVRSIKHPERIYTLDADSLDTDPSMVDSYGDNIRPHIVFFGEAVPNIEPAVELAYNADIFVVIGTSLVVYPAASLLNYVREGVPIYYIDTNPADVPSYVNVIKATATEGVAKLLEILKQ